MVFPESTCEAEVMQKQQEPKVPFCAALICMTFCAKSASLSQNTDTSKLYIGMKVLVSLQLSWTFQISTCLKLAILAVFISANISGGHVTPSVRPLSRVSFFCMPYHYNYYKLRQFWWKAHSCDKRQGCPTYNSGVICHKRLSSFHI